MNIQNLFFKKINKRKLSFQDFINVRGRNIRPLLSILIPTYNRADCLELNLSYLIPQIDETLATKIQILVADNYSSDHTKDVLKKYEKYSFFTALEAHENIGPELNFLKLIKNSSGKFVWIFGDDEVLYPHSLKKIVFLLEKFQDVGLVHMTQFGHTSLEEYNPLEIYTDPKLEIFKDSALFLEKISYNLSFITSNIYNRTFINSEKIPPDLFLGSFLNQQGFYLQAALKAEYNIYLTDRIFSQLLNNTGSYRLFEVFGVNQQKIFSYFKNMGLKERSIHKINNDLLKYFFPQFILLMKTTKENKTFISESVFKILYSSFKTYKSFWFFCFPLLVIPEVIRFHLFKTVSKLRNLFKKSSLV